MIVIGIVASRRQNNVEDYFIAGGRLGTFSIACLWLASYIGGASVVGGAARAYELGISAGWYITAIAIGCLLFGLFFAARVNQLGKQNRFLTYPELIESRYDSRTRIVATLTTVAAFIAYAAGQLAAAASILHTLLGWDYGTALLLASAIIVIYTAAGGYLAVTYTDWIQFALLFIGIVVIGIPVAVINGGTWDALTTQLPDAYFEIGSWGWGAILAIVVSISLSFFTAMDSYTRSFAAKNADVARRGTLLAVVFFFPIAVAAIWLGMTAALLFPGVENSNEILSTFIVAKFPIGLKGLVLVGVLAALMSTADICILTASANVSRDIYQRYINPQVRPNALFRISIGVSVVVGIVAAFMAWRMRDVVDILLVGFTINSAGLFLPSIAMIYFARVNSAAAFWSISLSLFTVIAWYSASQLEIGGPFEIDPLWPGLIVSFVVFTALNQRTNSTN
jgi:SSS family solute:Na+ symporter